MQLSESRSTRRMGNIPSTLMQRGGNLYRSGMGDIFSDLINAGTTIYGQQTSLQISQQNAAAAQAQAAAQTATAQAQAMTAALQAQAKGKMSPTVMLAAAGGLAVLLGFMVMRRKKRGG